MPEDISAQPSNTTDAVSDPWRLHISHWLASQQEWARTQNIRATVAFVAAIPAGLLYSIFVAHISFPPDYGGFCTWFVATYISILIFLVMLITIPTKLNARQVRKEQSLVSSLVSSLTVQALGDVLRAYIGSRSPGGRTAMGKVLIDLLDQQTDQNHAALSLSEQNLLYLLLDYGTRVPPAIQATPNALARHRRRIHIYQNKNDIRIKHACLQALPTLGDQRALPVLARMIVRGAPTAAEESLCNEAHITLKSMLERIPFGQVEDIPRWISHLPAFSIETGRRPPGGDTDDCLIAVFALTRLLPLLTPAHAALLNSEMNRSARKRLRHASQSLAYFLMGSGSTEVVDISRLGPDFSLAVLHAQDIFGDADDIPFVRSLANGAASTPDRPRIRERARQVLAILKERQSQAQISSTLLRGSSVPPIPANQLLRPATGYTGTEPINQLLRPHNAQSPGEETDVSITNRAENRDSAMESTLSRGTDTRMEGSRSALNGRSVTEAQPLALRQQSGGE